MSAWRALGPGKRLSVLALGGGLLAGAGALLWQATRPAETGPVAEVASSAPAATASPDLEATETAMAGAAPAPATASSPAPAPEPTPEPQPELPKIDTWRVAPDGEALVAGLAEPGATVAVVVDERAVAEGVALPSGEFVVQFTLPPNPAPSLMWLAMTPAGGATVTSPEMVALAPIAGPEIAVAEASPPPAGDAEAAGEEVAAAPSDIAPDPASVAATETAPAALLLTDEGAAVLQAGPLAETGPAGQVVIDTIAYTPAGAVQIGGRGAAGAALRLYLDNAEIAEAVVGPDGLWQLTIGDTAPGLYTLRVDQLDGSGKVTSRFETPFKRETPEALARAAGAGPADDAETTVADAGAAVAEAEPAATVSAGAAAEDAVADAGPAAGPSPVEAPGALPDPSPAAVTQPADAGTVPADPPVAAKPEPEALAAAAPPAPVTITVQPGFTLWGIAQERMGDGVMYVQVFEANRDKIKDPDLIYPGQVFSLPESAAP